MTVYDATFPISPTIPVWPGDPNPRIEQIAAISRGDPTNTSSGYLSFHTGTHVDAPYHILENGTTVDAIPLSQMIRLVKVVELPTGIQEISRAILEHLSLEASRGYLFKTVNSQKWKKKGLHFTPDYAALTPDAAGYLVEKNIKLVGVDGFSVDLFSASDLPVHHLLLSAGTLVIELLDLRDVPPGDYSMICAPLKITGIDGAPARVLLLPSTVFEKG